jgi:hypothetical protein
MKSILDSSFKYTHSSATDVRKTFARVRLEQQAEVGGEEEHAQLRPTASFTKVVVRRAAQSAS